MYARANLVENTGMHACKADCVLEAGRKILEARGKSRSTTFVQREKRKFQTAQNGGFPSVAIFAGQLKRNQLYVHTYVTASMVFMCFMNFWKTCRCARVQLYLLVDTQAHA